MANLQQEIKNVALTLLNANNSVTTLEIKTELRKTKKVSQSEVSSAMMAFTDAGEFVFTDNGTFRTYSLPVSKIVAQVFNPVKTNTKSKLKIAISDQKATITQMIDVLKQNKGKMLTVVFKKQDGSVVTRNGQFEDKLSALGYYSFKEKGTDYKQFDPKNLKEVRVNKTRYMLK